MCCLWQVICFITQVVQHLKRHHCKPVVDYMLRLASYNDFLMIMTLIHPYIILYVHSIHLSISQILHSAPKHNDSKFFFDTLHYIHVISPNFIILFIFLFLSPSYSLYVCIHYSRMNHMDKACLCYDKFISYQLQMVLYVFHVCNKCTI